MLDLLAFKAVDVPAKNIMPNGNFSDPSAAWSGGNSICTISNNELTIQTNSESSKYIRAGYAFTDPVSADDVIYASCYSFVSSDDAINLKVCSFSEDTSNFSNRFGEFDLTPDVWIRQSAIRKYTDNRTIGVIKYENLDIGFITSVKIKNVLFINLTKTFGAGNEPTKEQMDALLSQFPASWFDGTKNVFSGKKLLTTFFKDMTRLENAITSLGGG